jgi:hypothetical protein
VDKAATGPKVTSGHDGHLIGMTVVQRLSPGHVSGYAIPFESGDRLDDCWSDGKGPSFLEPHNRQFRELTVHASNPLAYETSSDANFRQWLGPTRGFWEPRLRSFSVDADKCHGPMAATRPFNSSCHKLLIELDRQVLVEQAFVDEPLVNFHQLELMTIDVANAAA